jgi:very-short-patch-repair endonuclease
VQDRDEPFYEMARLQHGVVSVGQARALGFSHDQVEQRTTSGRWTHVRRGVVAPAGAPSSWERDLLAALLSVGPPAVASHSSAARLLGLELADRPLVEVTVPRTARRARAGLVVHATRVIAPGDTASIDRRLQRGSTDRLVRAGLLTHIPITTAARTIIDLAGSVSARELGNLVDSAARLGLISTDYLLARLERARRSGLRGLGALERVMLDAGGHSWLERKFLRLMRESGLPRPRCQVVRHDSTGRVMRLDFHFDGTPVVAEVSGRKGHSSDVDRRRDARRRNELDAAGHVVREFVTADVIDDPTYVVATIRAALAGPFSIKSANRKLRA